MQYAPVAQWIRVVGFEPIGRTFESYRVYQRKQASHASLFSLVAPRTTRAYGVAASAGAVVRSAERSAEKLACSFFKKAEERACERYRTEKFTFFRKRTEERSDIAPSPSLIRFVLRRTLS